jgi:hypothetical protein
MGTVHRFPVERKQALGAAAQPRVELIRALRLAVDAEVGTDASFGEREATALALTNEATNLFLREELMAIADRHGDEVEVDGRIYRRHQPGTVTYFTLCGAVDIERFTYREVGMQNGPTIVPMELEAGVIEGTTPALGYRIALGYAKGHMRSCEEDMKADHRCPPSRSTLERTAKAIGTKSKQVAPRIERRLRSGERVPEGVTAVALGLDRTSVPMAEPIADGEAPTTRRKTRRKPYEREKPEPVNVNYRMGYVGTVSLYNAEGEKLVSRCYAASSHESPTEQVVSRMMADLRNALRQAPDLAVGVIQDGAPEVWNLLRTALDVEPLVPNSKYYEVIDRYHVNERLGEVLQLALPDRALRNEQLSRWNESLDQNDYAIYRIREWVRDRFDDAVAEEDVELIDKLQPHVTYFENNAHLMRYARLGELGLPIGSGATEGACKSVVQKRANSGGQRWRPTGLEAVLTLRAVHLSDRLPRFWAHFARAYRKEVTLCA